MKIKGTVRKIWEETHDVKTFLIDLEKNIDFTSGQYCLVSISSKSGYGDAEKPFTFVNVPRTEGNSSIELTIKKVGDFTSAMHSLKGKEELEIDGPHGEELNFDESIKKDIVFLAGGSGITPFISSLKYLIDNNLNNHMTLIFSNRTKDDIIYKKELDEMSERDNVDVINTLTHESGGDWSGEVGRIDRETVEKYIDDVEKKLWYICGPPRMVEAMRNILIKMEISKERIKWEDWQLPGKND